MEKHQNTHNGGMDYKGGRMSRNGKTDVSDQGQNRKYFYKNWKPCMDVLLKKVKW